MPSNLWECSRFLGLGSGASVSCHHYTGVHILVVTFLSLFNISSYNLIIDNVIKRPLTFRLYLQPIGQLQGLETFSNFCFALR
jgi:hypothetical protein